MSEEPACPPAEPEVFDHPKQQIPTWIGNRFGARVPKRSNSSPVAKRSTKMQRRILRKNVLDLHTRPLEGKLHELRSAEQEIHRLSSNSHEAKRLKKQAHKELREHEAARAVKLAEEMVKLKMKQEQEASKLPSGSSAASSASDSSAPSKSPTSSPSTPE